MLIPKGRRGVGGTQACQSATGSPLNASRVAQAGNQHAHLSGCEYTREVLWSDQTCLLHDMPPGYRPTLEEVIAFYEPEARPVIGEAVANALATGTGWDIELPMVTARG